MVLERLGRAIAAFFRPLNYVQRFLVGFCLMLFGLILAAALYSGVESVLFAGRSAADHLRRANEDCQISNEGAIVRCSNMYDALRELRAIPESAAEYHVALTYIAAIQQRLDNDAATAKQQESAVRTRAYERAQKNFHGQAQDPFTCATSTRNQPIISFDDRRHWWPDDGRCLDRLKRAKDADAEAMSYWPTTLRVDTDMDSLWLPDEERTCLSYPDDKGKIASVACEPTGSHRDHNIPVKFWGGVERDKISSWKCRREKDLSSDGFVCRAID